MAKTLALLFGVVFLLIGILGSVPALAPGAMVLITPFICSPVWSHSSPVWPGLVRPKQSSNSLEPTNRGDLKIAASSQVHGLQGRDPSWRSRVAGLKAKARAGLLLRFRRVRIHFARDLLLRFRRLLGIEIFIGSATAEDHRAADEENQTQAFHAHINNRRPSDFPAEILELAKLLVTPEQLRYLHSKFRKERC